MKSHLIQLTTLYIPTNSRSIIVKQQISGHFLSAICHRILHYLNLLLMYVYIEVLQRSICLSKSNSAVGTVMCLLLRPLSAMLIFEKVQYVCAAKTKLKISGIMGVGSGEQGGPCPLPWIFIHGT